MTIATLSTYTGNRIISSAATSNADFVSISANSGFIGERNDTAQINRWLLKFAALSDGTIPSNAVVSACSLWLYENADYSSNARTCEIFRPLLVWDPSTSTWNKRDASNNWNTAGCSGAGTDYDSTAIGSYAFTATEATGWKEFVITSSYIQDFVSGSWTNNGFLIKFQTENNDAYRFDVGPSDSNPPYMTVTYTVPGGSFFYLFN